MVGRGHLHNPFPTKSLGPGSLTKARGDSISSTWSQQWPEEWSMACLTALEAASRKLPPICLLRHHSRHLYSFTDFTLLSFCCNQLSL